MRIVAISDTHGHVIDTPTGDVLVHCGDSTKYGSLAELAVIADWFAAQPQKHKVMIAGNHDRCFEREPAEARIILAERGIHYLCDETLTLDGFTFYGSPWTPKFFDWAFMRPRGELAPIWAQIPSWLDVLITHGPPAGKLDWTQYDGSNAGCAELRDAVERAKPRLHVFGHIHTSYGATENGNTVFLNCCVCDEGYAPTREPQVYDL